MTKELPGDYNSGSKQTPPSFSKWKSSVFQETKWFVCVPFDTASCLQMKAAVRSPSDFLLAQITEPVSL